MTGLTHQQVQERIDAGQVNVSAQPRTRTYGQIIRENMLTFFNFLNIALFVIVLLVGSPKNAMFILMIVWNTGIGIIQEIRAKKEIDKLSILTQDKVVVLRDGKRWNIPLEQLVLDDVVFLKAGDQVPADLELIEGELEVNESLLTGESDNLLKQPGDELYSGSYITAGQGSLRVIRVGGDNYASRITQEAKEYKKPQSELRDSLNLILKGISIIILPLGCLLFYKQYFLTGNSLTDSVVGTVAAVIGMIPEGLVLLTSVALTIGAITLALKKTLVQELFCIETLARVDTLCLDKTGTITEGSMEVAEVIRYGDAIVQEQEPDDFAGEDLNTMAGPESDEGFSGDEELRIGAMPLPALTDPSAALAARQQKGPEESFSTAQIERILCNLVRVSEDTNATAEALKRRFVPSRAWKVCHVIPFSSERKYSGAVFEEEGTFLLGASRFLFPEGWETLHDCCARYASRGLRVLVLACSSRTEEDSSLPRDLVPAALVVLTDVIRREARETIRYFYEQGVDLKIISGDDPVTVAAIAERAGVHDADQYIDASLLCTTEELTAAAETCIVFGRVTPQQKKELVLALKAAGHTVAMTGDGVNDVLALKEADCSIAMAAGSAAAKNIANVVLLDSSFAAMPDIVNQGRRVINNIRTAASMFLIKTFFSAMLCLLTIFFGRAYPFEPIQMSLISACAVGIPTFLLAQENNFEKVDHTFLRHVVINAFPAAATIAGSVLTIMLVYQNVYPTTEMLNTACFLVTGWIYMSALKTVYAPLNRYRKIVIYGVQMLFFLAAVIFQNFLSLKALEFGMLILVFILMTFSPLLIEVLTEKIRVFFTRSLSSGEEKWYHRLIHRLRSS